MILINFSHPLTESQKRQIQELSGHSLEKIISLKPHFDEQENFVKQVQALLGEIPLSAQRWQTEAIVINPPALNFITAMVLSDLHGRMGYFPPILRMRPIKDSLTPRYEVAEIINLQELRSLARKSRAKEANHG